MSSALAIKRGHGVVSRARATWSSTGQADCIRANCNEVDNLVDEPGVTGHKSELMMSPASRNTWRGFSLALQPRNVFTELPEPTCAPLRLSAISPSGRIR